MGFEHPLARKAKIWPMKSQNGAESRVLVIVTTLALDPDRDGYKKKMVDRLANAAEAFLAESGSADAYILLNRMKEWG